MRMKCIPLLLLLLMASLFSFAGNGEKGKKEDPDMNGLVVAAETGKPLKDVSITAYFNTKKEKVVTSNVNGNFSLMDLKPGVYKFVFQKEGFEKVTREHVVLKYNEDCQLSIQMFYEENIFDLVPSPLRFSGAE